MSADFIQFKFIYKNVALSLTDIYALIYLFGFTFWEAFVFLFNFSPIGTSISVGKIIITIGGGILGLLGYRWFKRR